MRRRSWIPAVATLSLCALVLGAIALSIQPAGGSALAEYPWSINRGEALVDAPADIGFGEFTNVTHEPIEITGLTLVAPGAGLRVYRRWSVNLCSDSGFFQYLNGDPKAAFNDGSTLHLYSFQPIEVPPVNDRPTVPSGEGPVCSEIRSTSPLFYLFELIPTKTGLRELRGFNVSYMWEGQRYQQYEPYQFDLDVRDHRYWRGPPAMGQFVGKGFPST
jgi:hypothetical protein